MAAAADRVARVFRAGSRRCAIPAATTSGVFQIVFCDQGTPGVDGPQTYGRLRIALAERGVPAEQVRWVHEARTPAARTAVVRRLPGRAVSRFSSAQPTRWAPVRTCRRGCTAIHHLDAPWRPSDVEQREGRALRPGNLNREVEIVRYVTRKDPSTAICGRRSNAKPASSRTCGVVTARDRIVDDIGDTVLSYAERQGAGHRQRATARARPGRWPRLRVSGFSGRWRARASPLRAPNSLTAEQDRYRLRPARADVALGC